MEKPLFSVVIPTRNRPELLPYAAESVMRQSCGDFELIISNNCDRDDLSDQTRKTAARWLGDGRVRLIEPPQPLNMPDHWEFATRQSQGRYVAILTDRHVMRPSTLFRLERTIREAPLEPELIVWNVLSGYSKDSRLELTRSFTGEQKTLRSEDVLRDWARLSAWGGDGMYMNLLPRGLNSLYSTELAARIRKAHGRMFWPVSPDYTSAFLSLTYADSIVSLELPFYMGHGTKSNGQHNATFGIKSCQKDYPGLDLFEGCPERFDTVLNTLIRDFQFVRKLCAPRLDHLDIDLCGYYLSNYREFLLKEQLGSPIDLAAQYRSWRAGVAKLSAQQQSQIEEGLRILATLRSRHVRLRRIALKTGTHFLYHRLFSWLRQCRGALTGKPRFADVLEAAQATDHYLAR